jgi:hypothetical protein
MKKAKIKKENILALTVYIAMLVAVFAFLYDSMIRNL